METDALDTPTTEELLDELSRYGNVCEEIQPGDLCSKDIQRMMKVSHQYANQVLHRMLDSGEWRQVHIRGKSAMYLRPVSEAARKAAGV